MTLPIWMYAQECASSIPKRGLCNAVEKCSCGHVPSRRSVACRDALRPGFDFFEGRHVVCDCPRPTLNVIGAETHHEVTADFRQRPGVAADTGFSMPQRFNDRQAASKLVPKRSDN